MYPHPLAAVQLVTLPGLKVLVGLAFMTNVLAETVKFWFHQLQLSKYGLAGEPVLSPAFEPIRSYMPQPPGGPVSISTGVLPILPLLTVAVAALASVHEELLLLKVRLSP